MNILIWIGQILLASLFLITGLAKIFAYRHLVRALQARRHTAPIGMTWAQARIVGLLEIAGAIGVIVPAGLTPSALVSDYLLTRIAAACLALLMVAAMAYNGRRRESAAPAVAAFLLALFVIVGRWPH